jgi:5-methylcytosine-specific restriction protein B
MELIRFIEQYKQLITQSEEYDELYKWTAVKHFQAAWDVDAPNFSTMFIEAFRQKRNLMFENSWASIKKMAEEYPEETREMFKNLYDESADLLSRIARFQQAAEQLLQQNKINPKINPNWSHQQEERAIATYLAFRYPEKYYLYKYQMFRDFTHIVSHEYTPISGRRDNIMRYYQLANQVRQELSNDQALLQMHRDRLTNEHYPDADLTLLTQDFIWAVTSYLPRKAGFACLGASAWVADYFSTIREKIDQAGYCAVPWSHRLIVEYDYFKKNQPFNFYLYETRNQPIRFLYRVNDFVTTYERGQMCPEEWEPYLRDENERKTTVTDGLERKTWLLVSKATELSPPIAFESLKPHPNSSLTGGRLRKAIACIHEPNHISTSVETPMPEPLQLHNPNIILYGPPGTGKTHHTVQLAAEIAANRRIVNYDEARKVFKEQLHNQIEFITFHQNYAYEDFVQGLKPDTDDPEKLGSASITGYSSSFVNGPGKTTSNR